MPAVRLDEEMKVVQIYQAQSSIGHFYCLWISISEWVKQAGIGMSNLSLSDVAFRLGTDLQSTALFNFPSLIESVEEKNK